MRNQIAQIKKILQVYLTRGESLEQALRSDEAESAEKWLRLRTEAFHNLKALVHQVEQQGCDFSQFPEFGEMVLQSQEQDDKIADLIKQMQANLIKEYQTLKKSRAHLNRYQSGRSNPTGFENSA